MVYFYNTKKCQKWSLPLKKKIYTLAPGEKTSEDYPGENIISRPINAATNTKSSRYKLQINVFNPPDTISHGKKLSFSILFFSIVFVTLDRFVRFSWVKSHFERNRVGYLLHFSQFENIQWIKSYKPDNCVWRWNNGRWTYNLSQHYNIIYLLHRS